MIPEVEDARAAGDIINEIPVAKVDSGIDDPDDRPLPRRSGELVAIDTAPHLRRADLIHRRRAVAEALCKLDRSNPGKGPDLTEALNGNACGEPFAGANADTRAQRGQRVFDARRTTDEHVGGDGAVDGGQLGLVGRGGVFTPADFARFAPKTAYDMLVQVPGFTIISGNTGERGLGQANENVLAKMHQIPGAVDIEPTLTGKGYWILTATGQIIWQRSSPNPSNGLFGDTSGPPTTATGLPTATI